MSTPTARAPTATRSPRSSAVGVDAPFDLAHMTVPTLVIVGADDELAGDAEKLAAELPDASFLRVAGDHASVLIEPRFIEALVQFVRSVSAP